MRCQPSFDGGTNNRCGIGLLLPADGRGKDEGVVAGESVEVRGLMLPADSRGKAGGVVGENNIEARERPPTQGLAAAASEVFVSFPSVPFTTSSLVPV